MVKNSFKALLFLIFILIFSSAPYSIATSIPQNTQKNQITVTHKKESKQERQKRAIIPTIILGIFTFILAFLVFFVRSKVAKEIKKRQNK